LIRTRKHFQNDSSRRQQRIAQASLRNAKVDLGGALVARSEAAEVVQVREAALDHPALAAEAEP
jgi:hypothetical protein